MLTDFDGTLSPIVEDPLGARPLPGATDVLVALAARLARVAVVSGRPLDFLLATLPPSLDMSGLYGLETWTGGVRVDREGIGAWRDVVDDVAAVSARTGPEGMGIESKGLSLTLHFRARPDLADQVAAWAQLQAARSGLVVRAARMSIELHPPVDTDKGTAVTELAEGLAAVTFLGDDVGDLPAFDALDRLARDGIHTVRVGVRSVEAPGELLERADLVVEGPEGALDLLRTLVPATQS